MLILSTLVSAPAKIISFFIFILMYVLPELSFLSLEPLIALALWSVMFVGLKGGLWYAVVHAGINKDEL